MKATGITQLQSGEIYVVTDFLPMMPIASARRLYRTHELTIAAKTDWQRDELKKLLEEE